LLASKFSTDYARTHAPRRSTALTTIAPTLDVETPARLRTVIGRLSRRLRTTAAARDAGLTPSAISLLLSVVRSGPTRLSELGEAEGLNPTMLSRTVSGMVQDGLLRRSSDEGDRRAAWVEATASGRRLAERMRRERTDAVNAALAKLPDAQRRRIEQALPALELLAEELRGRRP
jgi:DNA-binding MarR family transcriptional regulator